MKTKLVALVDCVDGQGGSRNAVIGVFIALVGAMLLLAYVLHPGSVEYRLFAGFAIANYAMGARSLVRIGWHHYSGDFRMYEPAKNLSDKAYQLILVVGIVVILIFGVLAWVVGWTGAHTGIPYGIGVFIAITLYDWSWGRYLQRTLFSPPRKPAPTS